MGEMCYGCFSQLAKSGACPHCGYDPSEDKGKYPAALKPGTILNNRYILGRVLGQGGFGITYAAQDISSKQRVAVKEYLPTNMASREFTGQVSSFGAQHENFEHGKEGFMEEANALVDLKDNPYIVNVHDFFESNGTAYFVMEYVQGKNLKEYVKMMGGKLGQNGANNILLPIMEALEDVHSKGLVHRDIAPDNIIVTADNSAKLIDFGAARYSTGEKSLSLDVVLKHGYAPKEQYLRRGRQGPFTDVYAMAATYYYAVTGRVPPDALQRMEEDELVSPSLFGAKLSPNAENALMKALELQPADRYQTMGEFASAIKGEAVTMPEPAPIKPEPLPIAHPEPVKEEAPHKPEKQEKAPAKKKSKKPLAFAFAAVLVIAAAIFIGFNFMQPRESWVPWSFDAETGTLTIRGTGTMEDTIPDYSYGYVPWEEYKQQIKKVIIEEGITSIDKFAFAGCSNLTEISIPKSVENINDYAFSECSNLSDIVIPDSVTNIGSSAFYNCSRLSEIVIPDSVTDIGGSAFFGCSSIASVSIPDSVTSIGGNTFMDCISLSKVILPGDLTNIGDYAFSGCSSLVNITIPGSVISIGINAFSDCSKLYEVELPDGIQSIKSWTFSNCHGLKRIIIPKSVTSIGLGAFDDCNSLKDIYYAGSKTQWEAIDKNSRLVPWNIPSGATVHYGTNVEFDELISSPYDFHGELITIRGYVVNAAEQIEAANGNTYNRIYLLPSEASKTWENNPTVLMLGSVEMEGYIYYWLKTPFGNSHMIKCDDDTHSIEVEKYSDCYVVVTGIFKYEDNVASLELLSAVAG